VAHPEGVTGIDLARHIGVQSRGLGPIIVSILKWAAAMQIMKQEALDTQRTREDGALVSRIKIGEKLQRVVQDLGIS
jgi:hypothetical protein